jgi:hypothetical protein
MTTTEQPPTPTAPQPPKRHRARTFFYIVWGIIGAAILATVLAAVLSSGSNGTSGQPQTPAAAASSAPAAPSTAPAPAPVPDPQGKYTASADYVLANGIYDQNYLVAEVDLTNTGNVGEVVRVKAGWQLLGSPDITAVKTVHVPYGSTRVVRFHVPVGSISGSGSQVIDQVQSWQEAHMDRPYGDFHVKILRSYGPAH